MSKTLENNIASAKKAVLSIRKNQFVIAGLAVEAIDIFGEKVEDYAEKIDLHRTTVSDLVSAYRKFVAIDGYKDHTGKFSPAKIKAYFGNEKIQTEVDLFTALDMTVTVIRAYGKETTVKEEAQNTGKDTVSDTLSPTAEELKEERRRDHDAMAANSLKPEEPEEEKPEEPEEEKPEEPEETVVYVYIEYMGRKYKFTKEEMEAHCIGDAE